jgi:hypothetical protein
MGAPQAHDRREEGLTRGARVPVYSRGVRRTSRRPGRFLTSWILPPDYRVATYYRPHGP